MHPLLFKIGSIPIHTYGVLIAIGFLFALWTITRLCRSISVDAERALDLAFWCFIVGFIGARVLYIITLWDTFMRDPASMFKVWEGGLVFFGGPIAALPFGIWYIRHFKMKLWTTMDVLVPGLVINHAFGRLGCLAAGCCYGKPTGSNFGIILDSENVDASLRGVHLHPTQLYEASALLILFVGLLWIFKHRKFEGQVVLTYFMAYPVIRSIVEIFRGDSIRGFVIEGILSTSQFISIFVFAGALIALRVRLLRGAKS